MMKKLNVFFAIFISSLAFCSDAFSAVERNQAENLNKWQPAYWKLCSDFSIGNDNPCIGKSAAACRTKSLDNPKYPGDEYGILLMVAKKTSVGGAYFCPIMVIAANKDKGNAWTEYYQAGDNCVWLCRNGYAGEDCSYPSNGTITSCDTTKILQSNYSSVKAVGPDTKTNIENDIPNWGANYYDACGVNEGQEHDLILAISGWLSSGRGAWVRPYMIRAHREGWADMISWVDVYPATGSGGGVVSSQLACKNGFKPNSAGNDCVPIDNNVCGVKNWCGGWDEKNFKNDQHFEKMVGKCLQWRCKEAGFGLDKIGSSKCVSCGGTPMDGANPSNGTCMRCDGDKVFSETAEKSGYCAETDYIDKTKLLYGTGGQTTDIDKQCWTIDDIDQYKACIYGKEFKTKKESKKLILDSFKDVKYNISSSAQVVNNAASTTAAPAQAVRF